MSANTRQITCNELNLYGRAYSSSQLCFTHVSISSAELILQTKRSCMYLWACAALMFQCEELNITTSQSHWSSLKPMHPAFAPDTCYLTVLLKLSEHNKTLWEWINSAYLQHNFTDRSYSSLTSLCFLHKHAKCSEHRLKHLIRSSSPQRKLVVYVGSFHHIVFDLDHLLTIPTHDIPHTEAGTMELEFSNIVVRMNMRLKEAFFPSVVISPEERRMIKKNTALRLTLSLSSIGNCSWKDTKTANYSCKRGTILMFTSG